jgi:16S rRNA (guanine(966)-N(2))-methyltransferase RsmD
MFISNGYLQRRKLKTFPGQKLAESKVREVLYNVLGQKVSGADVLDLFGGSGAVGFEALSWGAASATFCEKDKKVAALIKENAASLDVSAQVTVNVGDAFVMIPRFLHENRRFSYIFVDPPYNLGMVTKTLQCIKSHDIVTPTGSVVLLCSAKEEVDMTGYETVFDRVYGYPRIVILRKAKAI